MKKNSIGRSSWYSPTSFYDMDKDSAKSLISTDLKKIREFHKKEYQ